VERKRQRQKQRKRKRGSIEGVLCGRKCRACEDIRD
jgi:hypothetical protein